MGNAAPLDPGTLDQVANALADIAVLADSELHWSDHGSDVALRRIATDATTALHHLGYEQPGTPSHHRTPSH
jgi:hypothetical protein